MGEMIGGREGVDVFISLFRSRRYDKLVPRRARGKTCRT